MPQQLTVTEAETLAVLLDSASRKMATVRTRTPGTGTYAYAWDAATVSVATGEMFRGFYDIAPYGVFI